MGDWYVKASVAATDNYAGAERVISFKEAAQREPAPNAAIDYEAEMLKDMVPNAAYVMTAGQGEQAAVTAGGSGTAAIQEAWLGATLSIVRKAESGDYSDSLPQSLPVPARPAAPGGLQGITDGENEGRITGVSSAIEYSADGTSWTACGGAGVTGLATGTYQVRTRATASAFAGKPAAVTIQGASALSITGLPGQVVYGDTFTLGTSGGSGSGAVTWSAEDPASVDGGGHVTVTGVGSVTIKAVKAADDLQEEATAGITFTAEKKSLTVTGLTAVTHPYDGTTSVVLTRGTLAGVLNGDDVMLAASGEGAVADANAGADKAETLPVLSLAGDHAEYYTETPPAGVTKEITKKPLADSMIAPLTTRPTPEAPSCVTDGSPSIIKAGDYTEGYSGNTSAGTTTATITAAESGNYSGSASAAFRIVAGTSQVSVVKTLNGTTETGVFTYGDTITVRFTPKAGGMSAISLPAPEADQAALFLGDTQLTRPVAATENTECSITYDTSDKGLPIGKSTLTVRYMGGGNLTGAAASADVTLNRKNVSVTASAAGRDYDGTCDVQVSGSVNGAVGTDSVAVTGGAGTMADANAGTGKAVTVTGFILSGADAGYYELSGQPAYVTVDIDKAAAPALPDQEIYFNYLTGGSGSVNLAEIVSSYAPVESYAVGSVTGPIISNASETGGILTFDLNTGNAEDTATIPMTVSFRNYQNAVLHVKATLTEKTLLTISCTAADANYTGLAYAGLGTPSAAESEYTGGFTVSYSGSSGASIETPVNAGSYTVTVTPADTADYIGRWSRAFVISPALSST